MFIRSGGALVSLLLAFTFSSPAFATAPPVVSGVFSYAASTLTNVPLPSYYVVNLNNPAVAKLFIEAIPGAQAAVNVAAGTGASLADQAVTAALYFNNYFRDASLFMSGQVEANDVLDMRQLNIFVDAAGNEALDVGTVAAAGNIMCLECATMSLTGMNFVTLSDGSLSSTGYALFGFKSADTAIGGHIVLANQATDTIVDNFMPNAGGAGAYPFEAFEGFYGMPTYSTVFTQAPLPPALAEALTNPGALLPPGSALPPETAFQMMAVTTETTETATAAAATFAGANFLANPVAKVLLGTLGYANDLLYVYNGTVYALQLNAATSQDIATVLGPLMANTSWFANSPRAGTFVANPPTYPGLTQYLSSIGVNPNVVVSNGSNTNWYTDSNGNLVTVIIPSTSGGLYRVTLPSGSTVELDQTGPVYDFGSYFYATGTDCQNMGFQYKPDGECVPIDPSCDPTTGSTCAATAKSGDGNEYCDPNSGANCSGAQGPVYGTQIGSTGLACDPSTDPTCPGGGSYCDPTTTPNCIGGTVPPTIVLPVATGGTNAIKAPSMPWSLMGAGLGGNTAGSGLPPQTPPPGSNPLPTTANLTGAFTIPGNAVVDNSAGRIAEYQGDDANGNRYFSIYPKAYRNVQTPLAFTPTQSLGQVAGSSFNQFVFNTLVCGYSGQNGYSAGIPSYYVPLTVISTSSSEIKFSIPSTAPPHCSLWVSQNNNYLAYYLDWGYSDNIITGPAALMTLAGRTAKLPISWKTRGIAQTEVHSSSPTGPVVATGGYSGTATLSGVTDGETFYLVDAQTHAMLVSYTPSITHTTTRVPSPAITSYAVGAVANGLVPATISGSGFQASGNTVGLVCASTIAMLTAVNHGINSESATQISVAFPATQSLTGCTFTVLANGKMSARSTSFAVAGTLSSSASFVKSDATTQGNWYSSYGADGYLIEQDSTVPPSYATVSVTGASNYTWTPSTTDTRALETGAAVVSGALNNRIASCWYTASTNSYTINVNITDGKTHTVAVYGLDWDGANSRAETVSVLDAATGTVLNTQNLTAFSGGIYLVWNISGNVQIKVTNGASVNSVIGGIFFGAARGVTPPAPTPVFSMNQSSYLVGSTATYTITGAAPNSTIYWTSTLNGASTGETNQSYGQVTNSSGSWSGPASGPWTTANMGSWTKTVTIAGKSATVSFTVVAPTPVLSMDRSSYPVGSTATYTITGAAPNTTIYWTSTLNGASTGETNQSYGQVTNSSGSWSGPGSTPWSTANVGNWTKTITIAGKSATASFSVAAPVPVLTMDASNYPVGSTATYTITGAAPNSTIYWTSTLNGVSTGEVNQSYGQVTDSSGRWSGTASVPWSSANVGNWFKMVTIAGQSSSIAFTVSAVPPSFSGGYVGPPVGGSQYVALYLTNPPKSTPTVAWTCGTPTLTWNAMNGSYWQINFSFPYVPGPARTCWVTVTDPGTGLSSTSGYSIPGNGS